MENPLELAAPEDPIQRVHELARDIAYGAVNNKWTSHFRVGNADSEGEILDNGIGKGLSKKWGNYHNYYAIPLLVSFGYLIRSSYVEGTTIHRGEAFYDITSKAFALLEKRPTPAKVFISYKREYSSALALLIEARLSLKDSNLVPFIDKDIPLGDEWWDVITKGITSSEYFICLLTEGTLASKTVDAEIELALNTPNCKIIPVCHNGYNFGAYSEKKFGERMISSDRVDILATKNALIVEHESASSYEDKINRLLNRLGYSTVK